MLSFDIVIQYGRPFIFFCRPQLLVLCKLDEDLKPKTNNLFAFVGQLKAGKDIVLDRDIAAFLKTIMKAFR